MAAVIESKPTQLKAPSTLIGRNKIPLAEADFEERQTKVSTKNTCPVKLRKSPLVETHQRHALSPRGGAAALPDSVKLLIGAGGIYAAFMYYGLLQEAVFSYVSPDGEGMFKQAWLLQFFEAFANVVVGFVGRQLCGPTANLPLSLFAYAGTTQVCAKAFTSLALASGVSFPVVTLAKSGKMVPVMIGSILLGGASYSPREYGQVAAIIGGTCIVSMSKKKSAAGPSSALGLMFIVSSLIMDGLTGGLQKRVKSSTKESGVSPKPYDFMFWTNFFMCIVAAVVSVVLGEVKPGVDFCTSNPEILTKILRFSICSAVGQSFIFYTIANFDPLVCTTVTTTRKIFSVLLSIFTNNHALSAKGWSGIAVACLGIMGELEHKYTRSKR
uniref:Sugar phosphate transporter domain-containing protein n=1 Tax=Octactis speculum TaxID=3111310 RepID=A0A7S2AUM5_9STRA